MEARLSSLAAGGLTVVVERSKEPSPPLRQALQLELVGNNRPGIVRDVSRLANQQINIDELQTEVVRAPNVGRAAVPCKCAARRSPAVTLDALRQQLESLAGELMVNLDVDSADEP